MSTKKITSDAVARLMKANDLAEKLYLKFDDLFVQAYGAMGLEVNAFLDSYPDSAPIFTIAPTLFDDEKRNEDISANQQYETPYTRLKIYVNEPVGYVQCEIEFLIEVPFSGYRFWIKSKQDAIVPEVDVVGRYEDIHDLPTLVDAILYDLFFIDVSSSG